MGRLRLPDPPRAGRIVLELEMVGKSYGDKVVFRDTNLLVERGDKIALVGPNGAGKSTLMRLLAGAEPPDSGECKLGHNVEVSFFSQDRAYNLNENHTVLENMMEASPVSLIPRLRNILGAFLFHGDDVDKKVKILSGGEESRLALAKMLLRTSNVLLLDEPTNHLDLDSKEVLLRTLTSYKGTLVFVSHDRYFIDELADKILEVGGGSVQMYWGNYEDYLRAKRANLEETVTDPTKPRREEKQVPRKDPPKTPTSKNRARRLREQLEGLEESIAETETGIASLEGRMVVPGFYDNPVAATEIVETHQSLKDKLETLYEEWEALAKDVGIQRG